MFTMTIMTMMVMIMMTLVPRVKNPGVSGQESWLPGFTRFAGFAGLAGFAKMLPRSAMDLRNSVCGVPPGVRRSRVSDLNSPYPTESAYPA